MEAYTADENTIAEQPVNIYIQLSRAISCLLHPLMIPTILVAVLVYGNTVLAIIAPASKLILLGTVAINTLVIPGLFIVLLHTLGYIPDLSLAEPRQRLIPMIILAVCYLGCAYMLSNLMLAYLIKRFLYGALGCVIFAFIVTFYWKISLHMTAMGGLVATLLIMHFGGFGHLPYTIMAFILLAGMLGSARLQLGQHNPAQVAAGFFSGFFIMPIVIFLF